MLWLIAMRGFAGSGKSTLARALSRELGWPLIDKDDIRDLLDDRSPEPGRLAYDVMLSVARRQLAQGLSVVCDSPLTYRGTYEQARRIAHEAGATLAVIECVCPDDAVWRGRIESRKQLGLPAHHQTDWDAFRAMRDRLLRDPDARYRVDGPRLCVDTTRPLADTVAEIRAWLRAGPTRDG